MSVARVLWDDQVDGLPDCGYCRVPEQLFGSFSQCVIRTVQLDDS